MMHSSLSNLVIIDYGHVGRKRGGGSNICVAIRNPITIYLLSAVGGVSEKLHESSKFLRQL